MNPFKNIVGQQNIVNRLKVSIEAPEGAKLAQPLLVGAWGLGKTEIAKPYGQAIADKMGSEVLFFNSPEEFRHSESTEYAAILNWFAAESGVLIIDECHKFGDKPTIQMQKVQSFLLKCLDSQNQGKLIQFDQDNSFTYDKSKKVVVMMTNYFNRINPALASRMDVCNLQPYTPVELQQICVIMLERENMVADNEKTVALMAKASRGSARPLYNMIQHFARKGLQTVEIEHTIETMRDLDMLPRGLIMDEIRLLKAAFKPLTKAVAKMMITGLADTLSNSVAYLMAHNLMTAHSSNEFKTTEKGKHFLSSLEKLGFIK